MIDTEDLEFIGNVLNLQNNVSVDLTLLKNILTAMRDNPELANDIKDSFSRNQFAAKSLLVDLIDQMECLDSESEVVIFGCWYGSVIIPKLSEKVKSIYGIDLDKKVIHLAKNRFWKDNPKIKLIEGDAFATFRKNYSTARLFINTSCEHMPAMKDWPGWSRVGDDAYFAFQSNNMYGIQGHINCVDTIEDFKKQLPLHAIVLHQEELSDERGIRFTLVGKIWSDQAIQERNVATQQKEKKMAEQIIENGALDQSQTKMLEFINRLSILDNNSEIVVFGCKHTVELMTTLAEGKKRLSGFDSDDSLVRSLKHNILEQYSNIEIIDADVITKNAKRFEDADLTINTICEHMPPMKEWESWKRFKPGAHVVFQSNNQTGKEGRINCVTSLNEFKTQLPINVEVLFEDETADEKSTRYTIIGKITA